MALLIRGMSQGEPLMDDRPLTGLIRLRRRKPSDSSAEALAKAEAPNFLPPALHPLTKYDVPLLTLVMTADHGSEESLPSDTVWFVF